MSREKWNQLRQFFTLQHRAEKMNGSNSALQANAGISQMHEGLAFFILGVGVSSICWIWFTRDWEDPSVKEWFDRREKEKR